MAIFLGIDIGTGSTKTLAIAGDGAILASATAEYPLLTPRPGWTEQHPADWWDAVQDTTRRVVADLKAAGHDAADVKGIGLSGQMHGSVFLDAAGRVIRPALLWNDQRTAGQCDEITERAGGRAELIRMVANPALTGFTAPKILWLREHEPEHFEKTTQVLLPKDYIRYELTGEFATEVSDASGTLLLDVAKRDWSAELLGKLDLDAALLPKVYESPEVSGTLSQKAADAIGLPPGVPVVGGGGDQAAGAVGNGIVRSGVISATMGTSGVVFAHSDEMAFDPEGRLHTFCHAVPGKWHVMGVILSAGLSLQWYRNQFAQSEAAVAMGLGQESYEVMTQLAQRAPVGSEGLIFLPYLTGERTPHADPNARGAWIGLSPRHGRPHLIRSVIEGATFAMNDSLEIIRSLGVPIDEIRVSGGGAKSAFWRQVQADIYGQAVSTINAEEGPAYGVALLAAVGTGAFGSVEEACEATIRAVSTTSPDEAARSTYVGQYATFGRLYPALRESFAELAASTR